LSLIPYILHGIIDIKSHPYCFLYAWHILIADILEIAYGSFDGYSSLVRRYYYLIGWGQFLGYIQLDPMDNNFFTLCIYDWCIILLLIMVLSYINSAGYVEFAYIPPTLAADIITYYGLLSLKKLDTVCWVRKSYYLWGVNIKLLYPWSVNYFTIADPTNPVWPATYILEFLSIYFSNLFISYLIIKSISY